MTDTSRDPSQLSDEELQAEIAAEEAKARQRQSEHTRPEPSKGGYYVEEALKEMGLPGRIAAGYGYGARQGVRKQMNMLPSAGTFRDWVQQKSGEYNLSSSDESLKAPPSDADIGLLATPSGQISALAGEGITTLPSVLAPEALLEKLPLTAAQKVGKFFFGGPWRRGATEGAIQGGVAAEPGDKLSGTIFGTGAGLSIPLMQRALRLGVRGVEPAPEMKSLMDRGVDLMPRQMNPESSLGWLQAKWINDLPIIGEIARKGEKKAWGQTERAMLEDVAPTGTKIDLNSPKSTSEILDDVYKAYGPAYNSVGRGYDLYPTVYNVTGTPVHMRRAVQDAMAGVERIDPLTFKKVTRFVNDKMDGLKPKPGTNGLYRSEDLLNTRSKIRDAIRVERKKNGVGDSLDQIRMLEAVEEQLTSILESQLPPDASAALKALDLQYAKYKILEDAMGTAAKANRNLTPRDITAAVGRSAGTSRMARGQGLMREWSDTASDAFAAAPEPSILAQAGATTLPALSALSHPAITGIFGLPPLAMSLTQTGRRIAGGVTAPQRFAQRAGERVTQELEKPRFVNKVPPRIGPLRIGPTALPILKAAARGEMLPYRTETERRIQNMADQFAQSPLSILAGRE